MSMVSALRLYPIMFTKSYQVMCDFVCGTPFRATRCGVPICTLCRSLRHGSSARHQWLSGCDSLSKTGPRLWSGASRGMHPWLCYWSASLEKYHWYVPSTSVAAAA